MWDHLDIFKGLPTFEVNHALERFKALDVEIGTELISEGDEDPTLVIVVSGELEILTGDVSLGRARPGEIVGEIALFAGGIRTATVRAAAESSLLVLDSDGYEALRAERHPVAIALEEHALGLLSDRLRKTRDRIASLAVGTKLAEKPPSGFFTRVAGVFGAAAEEARPVRADGGSILQMSRLFAGVPRDLLDPVAARMSALAWSPGAVMCKEGEPGTEMFLIATGEVEVVCHTTGANVERLATLGPGDAFGMCSLLQPDQPRMATAVAKSKVVALSLGSIEWAGLIHGGDWVGSILRVAMIRALAESLAYANAQIALLDFQRESDRSSGIRRAGVGTEAVGGFMGEQGRPSYYAEES
jgi:CRP-like cAMP-binding protein